jgi:hypothetical protein
MNDRLTIIIIIIKQYNIPNITIIIHPPPLPPDNRFSTILIVATISPITNPVPNMATSIFHVLSLNNFFLFCFFLNLSISESSSSPNSASYSYKVFSFFDFLCAIGGSFRSSSSPVTNAF